MLTDGVDWADRFNKSFLQCLLGSPKCKTYVRFVSGVDQHFVSGVDQYQQPAHRDQLLHQHCHLRHEGLQVPPGTFRREKSFKFLFKQLVQI